MDDRDEIIGALYEAAADRDAWPALLRRLAERLSASVVQYTATDIVGPGALAVRDTAVHGADPDMLAKYAAYYARIDPRVGRMLDKIGQAVTTRDLVEDPAAFHRSEFYNDLLVPTETQWGAYVFAGDRQHWMSSVAVMSAREPSAEVVKLLRHLNPHVQRALQLNTRLLRQRSRLDAAEHVLDELRGAVVLVAGDGKLLVANRAAMALLSREDGLLVRHGRITAQAPVAANALQALIAATHATALGLGQSSGDVLPAPRATGRPLAVLVAPLRLRGVGSAGVPTVALFVRDLDAEEEAPAEILGRLHGLTPGESRIAQELMAGLSVTEIAERRRVSLHTVKTQVKSLLHKTATSRQTDLVRLLERQIGWIRLNRKDGR